MKFRRVFNNSDYILMEGALGERLKREYGLKIDGAVAMANLIYSEDGKKALKTLWQQYSEIANKYKLPFIATTPTRRANYENVKNAGYDQQIILDNVAFLKEIQKDNANMFVGGLMGCKGEAYTGEGALSEQEAFKFHSWQANVFKKANVDFLYAGIMPNIQEACGMAKAMAQTGLPYIISFTIQENGKLIDGTTIHDAIQQIDSLEIDKPICYMSNCVHPIILYKALSQLFNDTQLVKQRFKGIQANTSALPYSELDRSEELKTSTPNDLAKDMKKLKQFYLKIYGGCCGTDNHHMEKIAEIL